MHRFVHRFGSIGAASALAFKFSKADCEAAPALPAVGRFYSWGSGQFGQLGVGNEKDLATPTLSEQLKTQDIKFVAAGASSTAAVTRSGDLYTFGAGAHSHLGHGAGFDTPNQAVPQLSQALQGVNVTQVAIGDFHMAAISCCGKVWSWGRARSPQLGHDNAEEGFPNKVTFPEGVKIKQLDCGRGHTMAVSLDGQVFSWGRGASGCLGHGGRADERTPRLVGGILEGVKVASVACGRDFSIAVAEDGRVFAWGANEMEQLGVGDGVRNQRTPAQVQALAGKTIVQVACGEYHAAAVTCCGKLFTWGMGSDGRLGHGECSDRRTPQMVESLAGRKIVSVACGGGHTAVVTCCGKLIMFGRGRSGQLGRGDQLESIAAPRPDPTRVEFFNHTGSGVAMVGLGFDHSVALNQEATSTSA
jgi:alpha-tubulin suppressor-like RCC1 family protein